MRSTLALLFLLGLTLPAPSSRADADRSLPPLSWEKEVGPDGEEDPGDPDFDDPEFEEPVWADEDGDGMEDGWELEHGLDPADPSDAEADSDDDGLSNGREYAFGSDPSTADSDGGGLGDFEEWILNQLALIFPPVQDPEIPVDEIPVDEFENEFEDDFENDSDDDFDDDFEEGDPGEDSDPTGVGNEGEEDPDGFIPEGEEDLGGNEDPGIIDDPDGDPGWEIDPGEVDPRENDGGNPDDDPNAELRNRLMEFFTNGTGGFDPNSAEDDESGLARIAALREEELLDFAIEFVETGLFYFVLDGNPEILAGYFARPQEGYNQRNLVDDPKRPDILAFSSVPPPVPDRGEPGQNEEEEEESPTDSPRRNSSSTWYPGTTSTDTASSSSTRNVGSARGGRSSSSPGRSHVPGSGPASSGGFTSPVPAPPHLVSVTTKFVSPSGRPPLPPAAGNDHPRGRGDSPSYPSSSSKPKAKPVTAKAAVAVAKPAGTDSSRGTIPVVAGLLGVVGWLLRRFLAVMPS